MNVVEVFSSIEGEGIRAGELSTFVRLAGCNLRCTYCDTPYALKVSDGHNMSEEDVLRVVREFRCKDVTLTGGEPLMQDALPLVRKLCDDGYKVNIETNGSIDVLPYLNIDNCFLTVDYKSKSSGQQHKMKIDNFKSLRPYDVIKLVIGEQDLDDIEYVVNGNAGNAWVYLSPIYGKIELPRIVDAMKHLQKKGYDMRKVRMQVQLHKVIWPADMRGV